MIDYLNELVNEGHISESVKNKALDLLESLKETMGCDKEPDCSPVPDNALYMCWENSKYKIGIEIYPTTNEEICFFKHKKQK